MHIIVCTVQLGRVVGASKNCNPVAGGSSDAGTSASRRQQRLWPAKPWLVGTLGDGTLCRGGVGALPIAHDVAEAPGQTDGAKRR